MIWQVHLSQVQGSPHKIRRIRAYILWDCCTHYLVHEIHLQWLLALISHQSYVIFISEIALWWYCREWIVKGGKFQSSILQKKDEEGFNRALGSDGNVGLALGDISDVNIERNWWLTGFRENREQTTENDPEVSRLDGQMNVDVLTSYTPTATSLRINYPRTLSTADHQ